VNFAAHLFREALTLSPTPSVPLGHHLLTQCESGSQTVLYFGTCIELQNYQRICIQARSKVPGHRGPLDLIRANLHPDRDEAIQDAGYEVPRRPFYEVG
jgi:hypothetical protein